MLAATIVVYGHELFSTRETKSTAGQFPVTESHSLSAVKHSSIRHYRWDGFSPDVEEYFPEFMSLLIFVE